MGRRMSVSGTQALSSARAVAFSSQSAIDASITCQLRTSITTELSKLREEFHSLGQQFGHVYRSEVVVDDGSPRRDSTVTHYEVTARPGARAPHVFLRDADGDRHSTIDLFDGAWSLTFSGPVPGWLIGLREQAPVPARHSGQSCRFRADRQRSASAPRRRP